MFKVNEVYIKNGDFSYALSFEDVYNKYLSIILHEDQFLDLVEFYANIIRTFNFGVSPDLTDMTDQNTQISNSLILEDNDRHQYYLITATALLHTKISIADKGVQYDSVIGRPESNVPRILITIQHCVMKKVSGDEKGSTKPFKKGFDFVVLDTNYANIVSCMWVRRNLSGLYSEIICCYSTFLSTDADVVYKRFALYIMDLLEKYDDYDDCDSYGSYFTKLICNTELKELRELRIRYLFEMVLDKLKEYMIPDVISGSSLFVNHGNCHDDNYNFSAILKISVNRENFLKLSDPERSKYISDLIKSEFESKDETNSVVSFIEESLVYSADTPVVVPVKDFYNCEDPYTKTTLGMEVSGELDSTDTGLDIDKKEDNL